MRAFVEFNLNDMYASPLSSYPSLPANLGTKREERSTCTA